MSRKGHYPGGHSVVGGREMGKTNFTGFLQRIWAETGAIARGEE